MCCHVRSIPTPLQIGHPRGCKSETSWYNPPVPTVAEIIRQAVRKSPLSDAEIARGSGIDKSHLSRFLSGGAGLGIEHLESLARFLGLEIIVRQKSRRKGK